jgi:hypothetical protein
LAGFIRDLKNHEKLKPRTIRLPGALPEMHPSSAEFGQQFFPPLAREARQTYHIRAAKSPGQKWSAE